MSHAFLLASRGAVVMKKPSLKTEYELISHNGTDFVYAKLIPCYPNDALGRIANLTQKEMAFITMAMDSIDLSQSSNDIEELRNKIKSKLKGTYAYE